MVRRKSRSMIQGAPKAREAKRAVSLMSRCVMHMQARLRSFFSKILKTFDRKKITALRNKTGVSSNQTTVSIQFLFTHLVHWIYNRLCYLFWYFYLFNWNFFDIHRKRFGPKPSHSRNFFVAAFNFLKEKIKKNSNLLLFR